MPPVQRNAPLPNAVNLFNCAICDKGYPRQTDYENHLRSYDHNHRQRLAEMKKLTAANEGDASRSSRAPSDMRSIPLSDTNQTQGLGSRFKKIGGAPAAPAAGGRFKKVGSAVSGAKADEAAADKTKHKDIPTEATLMACAVPTGQESSVAATDDEVDDQIGATKQSHGAMADGNTNVDETVTWEQYDVTKPSGCDHANCPGCVVSADAIDEDGWLARQSA